MEKDRVPLSFSACGATQESLERMQQRSGNIILTGFMGAGKSTVGRRLARRLGYAFHDLDELIVAREGRSIPAIFAAAGEDYFRECESAVLAEQVGVTRAVFSTGGGLVCREANRMLMRQLGRVVYLRAGWATLEQRLRKGRGRPLADPAQGWEPVRALWASRQAWYETADVVIDTDGRTVDEVIAAIVASLGEDESCSR